MNIPFTNRSILIIGFISALFLFLICSFLRCGESPERSVQPAPVVAPVKMERQERVPRESFPPDTNWPRGREIHSSGRIDPTTFVPNRDLIHFDDPSVWWESDHDKDDVENDHMIHKSMIPSLQRLIEMVNKREGNLKVHEAYRPVGMHVRGSLHKEGRAIDLTCDELGLEELSKLCWLAGFNWVLHESKAKLGAHVHCSVKDKGE